ncbi:MAG: DNA recombination protein RmuC [Verrucomicrobia bacterium]|nr:DNA recombination protein RmuC [Verrucomicrobiota bacterium]MDA0723497.1 DNA recombination protein RmuC [Verrucomicrobiota bacterium]MDA1046935.1 DNA recombination protein RmuC [Verrucomicrobiota bacterium]
MEPFYLVLSLFTCFLIGGLIVFLWAKGKQGLSREEEKELREKIIYAGASAQAMATEIQMLKATLAETREQENAINQNLMESQTSLAETRTKNEHLTERLSKQTEDLEQGEKRLREQFENLANKVLDAKTEKFTATNKENLKQVLDPLGVKIKEFQEQVDKFYGQDNRERAALREHLEMIVKAQTQLSGNAENLTNALKGDSKKQGDWGELILERTLEASGLEKGREFTMQETFDRKRPDAIIRLPENRQIIVDSKMSLTAYERWCSLDEGVDRDTALKEHLRSVRNHIDELAAKDYQSIEGITSLDYVLMFFPIEPAFGTAIRADSELYEYAFRKGIVPVTTSTLMATIRTVANVWRLEKQNLNAKKIAEKAGALYDKFANFLQDVEDIGKALAKASGAHEAALNKLSEGKGNILRRTEELKKLGITSKKEIPATFQAALAEGDSESAPLPSILEEPGDSPDEGEEQARSV